MPSPMAQPATFWALRTTHMVSLLEARASAAVAARGTIVGSSGTEEEAEEEGVIAAACCSDGGWGSGEEGGWCCRCRAPPGPRLERPGMRLPEEVPEGSCPAASARIWSSDKHEVGQQQDIFGDY